MKYFNKVIVFFVFMLFGYGVDTFAYDYKITNQTGGDVKVQLYYAFGKLNKQAELIESGSAFAFKFDLESERARCRAKKLESERVRCRSKVEFEKRLKAVVCLTKIRVSIQDSAGKWGKKKTIKIVRFKISPADREVAIQREAKKIAKGRAFPSPVDRALAIQKVEITIAIKPMASLCKNRSIVLSIDEKSKKVIAVLE